MKTPKRPWLIAVLASLVALAAAAIEPPAQQAPPTPAPAESTPPDPAAPADADAKAKDDATPAADEEEELPPLPPLPPDTVPAGPPPARFDPSEKVRADFPISFPIDT